MNNKNGLLLIVFCALECLVANAIANESVNPFLIYYGGGPTLSEQSIPVLAKYDLLVMNRIRYREVNGNTWQAIKNTSPQTKILLYQLGPQIQDNTDSVGIGALNNIGRYNNSRGSSNGSINGDHPDWFLKNSNGQRLKNILAPNFFLLDFGNKDVINYWSNHTVEDIAKQKWRADGVFVDEVSLCSPAFLKNHPSHVPVKYSNCQSWNKSMIDFMAGTSGALQRNDQLLGANIGNSIYESGPNTWQALAQRSPAPDILFEEGAFVVAWGSSSDVRHWPLEQWRRQIDLPSRVSRQVAMISHTDLAPGQRGRSHHGESVSHGQLMRYAVGSYLLARNASGPTTYFSFGDDRKNGKYRKLTSADVYDKFDIGIPAAKYEEKPAGQGLFFRRYSKGYVYVNPTSKTITSIKAESDAEFNNEYDNARQVNSEWYFDLKPHDAAIVSAKVGINISKQRTPPTPPVLKMQ